MVMGGIGWFILASVIASIFGSYYSTKKQVSGQKEAAKAATEASGAQQLAAMTHAKRMRWEEEGKQKQLRQEVATTARISAKQERDLAAQIGAATGADREMARYAAVAMAELSKAFREGGKM